MKKHIKKFMALTLTAAILAGSGGIYAATRSTTTQSTDSSTTTDTALTTNTSTTNTAAQATDSSSTNTTPPEKPDGDSSSTAGSTPPEKPDGENGATDGGNMPGQSSSTSVSYSAVKKISKNKTLTKGTYTSKTANQNAIWATGDITAKLSNVTVKKTGNSDGGDSTSFYGTNSGILASDGANLILNNIKVTTNATGANGVFCYGGSATTNNSSSDGTTVTIKNSTITTKADNSGGIMTTGGGTVKVNKGTYTTTGKGSPAVYSTADVTVSNATLKATASEGIVIEGKNKVTLKNCTLTDNNTTLNGQSTTYKNIFLYQSMSGDAASGSASFKATGSKITTKKGDTFYVTNTSAKISLTNNTITNTDSTGNFLRAQADSWGTSGSNGGDITLTMSKQKASGNIVIDSVSTLKMTMKNSSSYKGTINGSNEAKSISLTLDKSSKITLTRDSYVTSFTDADSTYSNINFNGYKLYVNGTAIN